MSASAIDAMLKHPARVYAAIAMVAAAILFLPDRALDAIGLSKIATDHRPWVGIIFVVALALLVAELGHHAWRHYRSRMEIRTAQRAATETAAAKLREEAELRAETSRARIARLSALTSDEKAMLLPFVKKNLRAQRVPISSATFRALQGSQVLEMASQAIGFDMKMDDYAAEVFIQPWALKHLTEHPELLK